MENKFKTKAQMNWEIGKELENKFIENWFNDEDEIESMTEEDMKNLFAQIRQNEYRRGKEDANIEATALRQTELKEKHLQHVADVARLAREVRNLQDKREKELKEILDLIEKGSIGQHKRLQLIYRKINQMLNSPQMSNTHKALAQSEDTSKSKGSNVVK